MRRGKVPRSRQQQAGFLLKTEEKAGPTPSIQVGNPPFIYVEKVNVK
jgi:hypothetical protein